MGDIDFAEAGPLIAELIRDPSVASGIPELDFPTDALRKVWMDLLEAGKSRMPVKTPAPAAPQTPSIYGTW